VLVRRVLQEHQCRAIYVAAALGAAAQEHLLRRRDDDQSIYSWRGAQIENILKFENGLSRRADRPARGELPLDPGNPCRAAGVIDHNRAARQDAVTRSQEGDKVTVRGLWAAEQEARWAATRSEALQRKRAISSPRSRSWCAPAIRPASSRSALNALALPYRVVGGPALLRAPEIPRSDGLLRLINQPADDLAFERIVNMPRRGIGTASLSCSMPRRGRKGCRWSRRRRRSSPAIPGRPPGRPAVRGLAEGGAQRARRFSHHARPLARRGGARQSLSELSSACSTSRATRGCGRPTRRPTRPAGSKILKGAGRRDGRVREPTGFLEHVSL